MEPSATVIIVLPAELDRGEVVLAAALTLFGARVHVVVVLDEVEQPTAAQAETLSDLCERLVGRAVMPDLSLLGGSEAGGLSPLLTVGANGDPIQDALAVVLLAGVASGLDPDHSPQIPAPRQAPVEPTPAVTGQRDALIGRRDTAAAPPLIPTVVVVAQVQSTWGAVDTLCQALASRDDVTLEVVCVDSEHELRDESTAAFVAALGYSTRTSDWLQAQLAIQDSPVSLVVFYDPWDGLRPEPATALAVANAGVRVAYLPYGNNVGAGEDIMEKAYNLPVHQLAWRTFARSSEQRRFYAENCTAGDAHVRVMGLPKFDRANQAREAGARLAIDEKLSGLPVVVWNPQFTFGPAGWSTFDRYLDEVVDYAERHADLVVVIRPHFRLLRDLPMMGEDGVRLFSGLVRAESLPNVVIDRAVDYLPTFRTADAMMSDASSLLSEFVVTGKPAVYLHKDDGPGLNPDADYFFALDVATSWTGVEEFLDAVRTRATTGRERRDALLRRHFPLVDGLAGERIAAELLGSLRLERAVAAKEGAP